MKIIAAKVSDDFYEMTKNKAKANNLTVSFLIKQALNNIKIKDKTLEIKKLKELNRIGNNLNQITKKLNITKYVDNRVLEEITEIRKMIHGL